MAEALVSRLRTRSYKKGSRSTTVYQLDLRGKQWGRLGLKVLRNPRSEGWPEDGETTDREATAERWLFERYGAWVVQQMQGVDVELTVEKAAENYVKALVADPDFGPRHPTVKQRKSYVTRQLIPGLGSARLLTLDRDSAQAWLDGLRTREGRDVSPGTRDACRATLSAVWRHAYGSRPCPFAGLSINRKRKAAAHRKRMVAEGKGEELVRREAYTPSEIHRLLLTARWAERHPEAGVLAPGTCRNVAASIAIQLALASRISELADIRWKHVDEKTGWVLVAGTKTENSVRSIPLQESLRPWLQDLREKQGESEPTDYLFRTRPGRSGRPLPDIYARRMDKVQHLAGLKIGGKRSHVFRATHSSWAMLAGLESHEVKLLLGHSGALGGATDAYVSWLKENTRPMFWTYLSLPSPQEIDGELDAGWTP